MSRSVQETKIETLSTFYFEVKSFFFYSKHDWDGYQSAQCCSLTLLPAKLNYQGNATWTYYKYYRHYCQYQTLLF